LIKEYIGGILIIQQHLCQLLKEDIGAGIIDDFRGRETAPYFIYIKNQLIKEPNNIAAELTKKKNLLIGSFIDILL
jgi:hypothetical protein